MGLFFYSLSIHFYALFIRIAALWNDKAKKWIEGRKDIFESINQVLYGNKAPIAWFHCASLGEFEQARPVIEQFRIQHPTFKIFLTFFSPSGYEVRKNYVQADYVFYLPLDTAANARNFIRLVNPTIAFFTKYEFWHYYLSELHKACIPAISFSSIFRNSQLFFKPYGGFYRHILTNFTHLFVQNKASMELLQSIRIQNVTLTGDTRFDRVKAICDQKKDLPMVAAFKNNQKLIVIGSSWPQDMEVLIPFLNKFQPPLKVIIAPHEIHEAEIEGLQRQLRRKSVRFSKADSKQVIEAEVLIIDNIGMLSSLYQYGEFAYIGGAFGKGLHNILEAATFGMPVFFGPNYGRFQEAKDLVRLEAAFPVKNTEEFNKYFTALYQNEAEREKKAKITQTYVGENTGATDKILAYCKDFV